MTTSKRAFTSLATALVLGATILGLTVEPAAAEKKKPSKDDGTRCMVHGGPYDDDMTFFMPGEVITHPDGTKYRCGSDGNWYVVNATQPRVPSQVPSGTFTPAPSGAFTQTP